MKTCILLYGILGDHHSTYNKLIHSLKHYDFDIYCSFNNSLEDKNAILFSEKEFVKDVMCHEVSIPLWIQNMKVERHGDKNKTYVNAFHRHMLFMETRNNKIYDEYIFIDVNSFDYEEIQKTSLSNNSLFTNEKYYICNYDVGLIISMIYHELENLYYKGCFFDEHSLIQKSCHNKHVHIYNK